MTSTNKSWRRAQQIQCHVGLLSKLLVLVSVMVGAPSFAAELTCDAGDVPCVVNAINIANTNGEENSLTLAAGVYQLTAAVGSQNGLPVVTGNITLRGVAGATVFERSTPATAPFRFLRVDATGEVTLDGLVIQRFGAVQELLLSGQLSQGGAIDNAGTLMIVNSTITGNFTTVLGDGIVAGGAIVNVGTLIIEHSSVTHNRNVSLLALGGGIINGGTLIIEHSAITDNVNVTGPGGGIFNSGSMVIVNSTVARNRCVSGFLFPCRGSGGIANCRSGTPLNPLCLPTSISNATPSLVIRNSTVLDNSGGGIANANGTVWLQNTIMAHNGGLPDCSGVITSLDNNIVGDITGCLMTLEASDIIGDPLVGEFSDNGIPGSGHFPLMAGSPAIDAGGDEACSPMDQLGRPRAGRCDIGAIEFQTPIVNDMVSLSSLVTSFDGTPGPNAPAGTVIITATVTNVTSTPILAPFFRVVELSGGNLLLNADGTPGGVGARLTPGTESGAVISPGASFSVDFVIGLQGRQPFTFFVNLMGVPDAQKSLQ